MALEGTFIINNPFWWSADDKFFNYVLASKLGVAIPKTVLLPQHSYIEDINSESLRNLEFPIDWEAIVEYLKSPVRHSLDAFILNEDHEIIRRFREALRGPPGRKTKSLKMQEPYFWTSTSSNLPHNKHTRKALKLNDTARYITRWGEFGAYVISVERALQLD